MLPDEHLTFHISYISIKIMYNVMFKNEREKTGKTRMKKKKQLTN
jgi:hypothetical protein